MLQTEVIDKIRNETFAVAFTGEAPECQLVQGWDAVILHINQECGAGEADELPDLLMDEDDWFYGNDGLPFRYKLEIGECVCVTVFRITAPVSAHTPKGDVVVNHTYDGDWRAIRAGGTTTIVDATGNLLLSVRGELETVACKALYVAYSVGFRDGNRDGQSEVKKAMRNLFDIPHSSAGHA